MSIRRQKSKPKTKTQRAVAIAKRGSLALTVARGARRAFGNRRKEEGRKESSRSGPSMRLIPIALLGAAAGLYLFRHHIPGPWRPASGPTVTEAFPAPSGPDPIAETPSTSSNAETPADSPAEEQPAPIT